MRGLPQGNVMPVEQCWRLAQRWYHGRLDPDWRPRTTREAEGIFRDVGLSGEFWRLQ